MKIKKFFPGIIAAAGVCFFSFTGPGQHNVRSIVKNNIGQLAPYNYDCYALKEITYGPKEQTITVQFSVYLDEDYKLLFCKTMLPQSIDIYIYDKNPNRKDKKLIYFDESGKKDQYVCNFRPTATGSYYIVYKVPPATEKDQKGSIMVLIGVKDAEETTAAAKP